MTCLIRFDCFHWALRLHFQYRAKPLHLDGLPQPLESAPRRRERRDLERPPRHWGFRQRATPVAINSESPKASSSLLISEVLIGMTTPHSISETS